MHRLPAAAFASVALLALAACASGPPVTPSTLVKTPAPAPSFKTGEEDAILAIVDQWLLAAGNGDEAAILALSVPEGSNFAQRRTPASEGAVSRSSIAETAKRLGGMDHFIERYWSPTVMVRGGIAMVWAPYELRDNGQVVHCGIDAFDMVKRDGKWRVGNVMFTMEPEACGEIKPPSVSVMRPRDGWKETPNQ